jgi:hypothetical protein
MMQTMSSRVRFHRGLNVLAIGADFSPSPV